MIVFTLDLKNQPGELAHVCEALAERGVNIELAGMTAGDHGLVSLTASDEAVARAALGSASVPFTEHPVLRVTVPDRPGEAARLARTLADAHINIDCLIPISICGGEVTMAIGVDRPDQARDLLGAAVTP